MIPHLKAPQHLPKEAQTPLYAYSELQLSHVLGLVAQELKHVSALPIHVHFAMKSNHNPHVLGMLKKAGFGADLVSGGELRAALAAGFESSDMIFSGVGKTNAELEAAIAAHVGLINIESESELRRLADLASQHRKKIQIGFRVNPDVNANTHPYIATGLSDHKFGLEFERAWELYREAKKSPWLDVTGISMHIGSQIFDHSAFEEALNKTIHLARQMKAAGIELKVLDAGGGLGVRYDRELEPANFGSYFALLRKAAFEWANVAGPGASVCCELGRSLVAQCGHLVSQVLAIKNGSEKTFAIVDASMTELIRPALYDAEHPLELWLNEPHARLSNPSRTVYEIVGPVCESSDTLAHARALPALLEGDLIRIGCAGAYGYVMASHYNLRPIPQEWWITKDNEWVLSRPAREL